MVHKQLRAQGRVTEIPCLPFRPTIKELNGEWKGKIERFTIWKNNQRKIGQCLDIMQCCVGLAILFDYHVIYNIFASVSSQQAFYIQEKRFGDQWYIQLSTKFSKNDSRLVDFYMLYFIYDLQKTSKPGTLHKLNLEMRLR